MSNLKSKVLSMLLQSCEEVVDQRVYKSEKCVQTAVNALADPTNVSILYAECRDWTLAQRTLKDLVTNDYAGIPRQRSIASIEDLMLDLEAGTITAQQCNEQVQAIRNLLADICGKVTKLEARSPTEEIGESFEDAVNGAAEDMEPELNDD